MRNIVVDFVKLVEANRVRKMEPFGFRFGIADGSSGQVIFVKRVASRAVCASGSGCGQVLILPGCGVGA